MAEYNLYGYKLSFTDREIQFWSLWEEWNDRKNSILEQFRHDYHQCNSLSDFCSHGREMGLKFYYEEIDRIQRDQILLGEYDITPKKIIENSHWEIFESYLDAFDAVDNKYRSIVLDGEEYSEYLKAKKNARSKWVGGGFGLSGAVKGAVAAGAVNAVTGIFSSAGNLVAKGINSAVNSMECNRIFKSGDTLDSLITGLATGLNGLRLAEISYYVPESLFPDRKKAENLYDNLEKIPEENQKEVLVEILNLNPCNMVIYKRCFDSFDDANLQLYRIAAKFGLGEELNDYKSSKLITQFDTEHIDNISSLEDLGLIEKKYKALISRIGVKDIKVSGDKMLLEKISERITQVEKERKEVQGHTFASVEEGDLARKICTETQFSFFDSKTYADYNELEKQKSLILSNYGENNVTSAFCAHIDKKEKTVNRTEYESIDDAAKAYSVKLDLDSKINNSEIIGSNEKLEELKNYINSTYPESPFVTSYLNTINDLLAGKLYSDSYSEVSETEALIDSRLKGKRTKNSIGKFFKKMAFVIPIIILLYIFTFYSTFWIRVIAFFLLGGVSVLITKFDNAFSNFIMNSIIGFYIVIVAWVVIDVLSIFGLQNDGIFANILKWIAVGISLLIDLVGNDD